eukprot:gene21386-22238_t
MGAVDVAADFEDDLAVRKVNIDAEAELRERLGATTVPTLILYRDGAEVDRVIGARSRARLSAWIESHLRVKAELLAQFDRHIAAGTMRFGPSSGDDSAGRTPLVIATGDTDPDAFVAAYGYPLALAALLDPLAAMLDERESATAFVRDWVALVEPGTDLSGVPSAIVLDLLDAPETRGLAPGLVAPLTRLHQRERAGETVPRGDWARCRQPILAAADAPPPARMRGLLDLWEAAG